MRIEHFPNTDSLNIDLAERAGVSAREVGDSIAIDVGAGVHPLGVDALEPESSVLEASVAAATIRGSRLGRICTPAKIRLRTSWLRTGDAGSSARGDGCTGGVPSRSSDSAIVHPQPR